jgi:hypothetical protein
MLHHISSSFSSFLLGNIHGFFHFRLSSKRTIFPGPSQYGTISDDRKDISKPVYFFFIFLEM